MCLLCIVKLQSSRRFVCLQLYTLLRDGGSAEHGLGCHPLGIHVQVDALLVEPPHDGGVDPRPHGELCEDVGRSPRVDIPCLPSIQGLVLHLHNDMGNYY